MTLQIDVTVIAPPTKSPNQVIADLVAAVAPNVTYTAAQYKPSGAEAYPGQVAAIHVLSGPRAELAALLEAAYFPNFTVVRKPTALVGNTTEAMNAASGTNIAASGAGTNNTVSPSRTGAKYTPNGPLATARPNYALLLQRLDV